MSDFWSGFIWGLTVMFCVIVLIGGIYNTGKIAGRTEANHQQPVAEVVR